MTTNAARDWRGKVSDAAANFERRWTRATLERVDRDVAQRLGIQRGLFNTACFMGTPSQIEQEGAALVRGYGVAVEACEGIDAVDDAYLIGRDEATGTMVAIGWQRAALDRVREQYGDDAVWMTPDDCVRLLVGNEAFKVLREARRHWPGAELIDGRDINRASGSVDDAGSEGGAD